MGIQLDADEVDPPLRGGDGAAAETETRVHRQPDPGEAVQLEAVLGQPAGEGRGMGAVLVAALDRFVGNEPGVAAAAAVAAAGPPAGNIGGVLIGHADRRTVQWSGAAGGELKDEFVAVVDEAVAVDRLVVT